jgi:hypothetical protein
MTFRNRLLSCVAALALTANAALAAIDGQALADAYLAEGYTYVEVKVGPAQTKVEAIRGTTAVEVIYDNETQAILKQETETADAGDVGRTGSEVRNVGRNFLRDGDDDEDHARGHDDDDEDDDHDGDHGDDHDDDDDEDGDDDHGGNSGHDGDDD